MKREYIEGINGSIEIRDKYIYLTISKNKNYQGKSHVIWFEEIEDITFKKPTRDKYGHITLYLSTESYITKEKIKYTILLDKVNEKYLDTAKKIYSILNEIASNNRKITIEEKDLTEEELNDIDIDDNTFVIVKDNINEEENKKDLIKLREDILEEASKQIIENGIEVKKNEEQPIKIKNKNDLDKIKTQENIPAHNQVEEVKKIDENTPKELFKENQIKEEKNKDLEIIDELEKKLHDLESKLRVVGYKQLILNKYVDETTEKEKLDSLIKEILGLISELETIKKEVEKSEKKLSSNKFLTLDNGKVIITSISKELLQEDKEKLDNYVKKYKEIIEEIENIENKTEELSNNADLKKEEIGIKDAEYEKDINLIHGVESTKELIKQYREEAEEDIKKVRREIETTIEPRSRFRFVRRGISQQTRRLSGLLAINSLRPGHSRALSFALTVATGISSIVDTFSYDIREEKYNEIIRKETLVGLNNVDTEKARSMITSSKEMLDSILKESEEKYGSYPEFNELKNELDNIRDEIDKEDKILKETEEKLQEYKDEEKVKILRYTQE